MNWITTNIRLPEDLYLELKMEAFKQRKSLAQVARERMAAKKVVKTTSSKKAVWKQIHKFANEMAKRNPGINLSEKLIEMRYEQ